ncbi:hypothetical protein PHLCEN_2v163 [Hermanssonia centrifuga]|uniref:Ribosomal protein S8 n=1 Tax=Hermanssonia centrifuga TaxID=98765 RepID=A0A2R6S6Q7_9APHY|nr:hypothetical protein PHLCEN_2v163 [Hermanssonia centrifuga]
MVLPHDFCAHLQNAFRARHQQVVVHHTRQNLGILSILLRTGFISSINRGTITSSSPDDFNTASDVQRRIWADLKYREDRPVLNAIKLISKPSKSINVDLTDLRLICSGRRAKQVKALRMGEIAIIRTQNRENEWLEAREALELGLDGEIICRVS